jgi:purine-nucleoside phosphorylase
LHAHLALGDIVLAMTASTDSQVNKLRFDGMDYAPAASFPLLLAAYQAAQERGLGVHVGGVLTSDRFYVDDPGWWRPWAAYGALVAEMETAGLYTLAAKFGVDALSILTVSDNIVTGKAATAEQRERAYPQMAELALAIAP